MKNRITNLITLILLFAILFACNRDEDVELPQGVELQSFDKEMLTKLDSLIGAFSIWEGFNFSDVPTYVILTNSEGLTNGYAINSEELGANEEVNMQFQDIIVHRNNQHLELIDNPEQTGFRLQMEIEGVPHLLVVYNGRYDNYRYQFYYEYSNSRNSFLQKFIFHEAFHVFQRMSDFVQPPSYEELVDYTTLTKEEIALRLLHFDLMSDLFFIEDESYHKEALEKYAATMAGIVNADESDEKNLSSRHAFIETFEGTARLIESFTALQSIDPTVARDPTHGWRDQLYSLTTRGSTYQHINASRIWYHTGASAAFLLVNLIPSIEEEVKTKTLYQAARDFLSMSDADLEEKLEQVKVEYQWSEYLEQAEKIMSLPLD